MTSPHDGHATAGLPGYWVAGVVKVGEKLDDQSAALAVLAAVDPVNNTDGEVNGRSHLLDGAYQAVVHEQLVKAGVLAVDSAPHDAERLVEIYQNHANLVIPEVAPIAVPILLVIAENTLRLAAAGNHAALCHGVNEWSAAWSACTSQPVNVRTLCGAHHDLIGPRQQPQWRELLQHFFTGNMDRV